LDSVDITWDPGLTRWNDVGTSKRPLLDKNGFYGIVVGRFDAKENMWKDCGVQFIGMAFDQTLRQRLLKPHDADPSIDAEVNANPGYERAVMVGALTRSSLGKVTWDLVNAVECCLIFSNQPPCNTKCKDAYSGKGEVQVTNLGDFAPLKNESRCSPTSIPAPPQ